MASKRVDVNINGKDNTKGAFTSAANNMKEIGKAGEATAKQLTSTQQAIQNIGKTGRASGQSVASGMSIGQAAMNKLGTTASTVGSRIGSVISKGAQTASQAIQKLGTTASATFTKVANGAAKAGSSLDGISGAITGIAGSYGAAEMASDAWTGATQRQFNVAYLGTKMSTTAANDYIKTINEIVAAVPGDDTFMNTILTGAVARQTNLTTTELKSLGSAVADYTTVSQAMGKSMIETQMDLKEYVQTGNTGQLERDSILKNQMSTLKGQATVSDRILALQKALTAEGYSGLSALDIASIKFENLKGKFQLALTNIGSAFLLIIEPIISFFTMLDEKTYGASTTIMVLVAGVTLLGVAFVGILSMAVPALTGLAVSLGVVAEGATFAAAASGLLGLALGPVGLAIIAITAAVAVGIVVWSLWSDKIMETFGFLQSGNWGGVAANLGSAFNYVKEAVVNAIAGIPAAIGNLAGSMVSIGSQIVQWLVSGLTNLAGWLDMQLNQQMTSAGGSGGQGLIDGFTKWLDANGPTIVSTLITVITKLIPLLVEVGVKASMMLMQAIGRGIIQYGPQIIAAGASMSMALMQAIGRGLAGLLGRLVAWIISPFQAAGNRVIQIWNNVRNIVSQPIRSIANFLANGWATVIAIYNNVRNLVSQGASSVISFFQTGLDAVQSAWNWITSNVHSFSVAIGMSTGPRGPAGPGSGASIASARGPSGPFDGMNFRYMSYGGHKDGYPKMQGNTLIGNCVDMSMGMMAMNGGAGKIVPGTWNGGSHVWYQDPAGNNWDGARKALNGTFAPPPRGPADGYGNVVINGDVYGFDDFQKKVEQANNKIFRGRI